MKSFQALRSPAIPLTSFHDLLVLLISSSVVLRHVLFGLPLLLYPWGFQSNSVFSIAPVSLRNVCPIQFHFLLFIWFSIDFWWVILRSSSFVILSVHFIFIIGLKHLFTNMILRLINLNVVCYCSVAYEPVRCLYFPCSPSHCFPKTLKQLASMHSSSVHFKSLQYLSLEHVQFLNACRLCSRHTNNDECIARTRRFPSETSKTTYI